ncbi:hypothetical protein [Hallella colorans]|uniref:Phospholipase n=1 Tax=Hallella colorans TaxID=1703337 RepID=A0A2U0U7F9_9BACT|nr:hypothetical protein [Hallella colorans]PVX53557.1 hypothetical protein C7379_11171 [Hallella colorans]
MLYLLLSLIVLGFVTAIMGYVSYHRHGEEPIAEAETGNCATCADPTAECEQVCLMRAATKPVEYFDDEELDAYKGRSSDAYTEEETDEFAEVLETLRPEEVRAWSRSLTLRGINMPDGIKSEYIQLAE